MIDLIRKEKAHKIKQKQTGEMCFLQECRFILGCGKAGERNEIKYKKYRFMFIVWKKKLDGVKEMVESAGEIFMLFAFFVHLKKSCFFQFFWIQFSEV